MIKTLAHFFSFCLIFSMAQNTYLYAKLPLNSGLPIPRFAALRSADVNLRTGPGTRYPISWVIKKKFLPVKVIAEQENWRKIELHDGTIGWVFQSMLTGNKTAMINISKAFLRRAPQASSSIIVTIGDGIIGQLKLCKGNWCRLTLSNHKNHTGWIEREHLWGAEFDKK
ncbi:MAG: SH3 domain-containing protein [Alphaproteobacteria bacterium]|nr:SH3 domain-containing protein [Alphaproteobacteria bacterium]